MNPKAELDNTARLQQMKINTRLVALETAMKIMNAPNYSALMYKNDPDNPGGDSVPEIVGGKVDIITLLAMALEVESYILGNIEAETKEALEKAAMKFNAPKIVRP